MKPEEIQITTLSTELRQIINDKHGEQFDMLRLCRDHRKSIKLPDKNSVLNILQDDLVGVFDMKSGHFFLDEEQVLRFAIFCELPVSGIIGLLLKAEWEFRLAKSLEMAENRPTNYDFVFKNKKIIDKFIPEFTPDKGAMINLLIHYENILKRDFEINKIELYIQDLLIDLNFLKSTRWISEYFCAVKSNENKLLRSSSDQDKQKYYQLKELWRFKTDEFAEYLFILEKKKRVHTNIENSYMRIFGKLELENMHWSHKEKKYRAILGLMEEYPDLSFRELLTVVNKFLNEMRKENAELKSKIDRSHTILDISSFPHVNTVVSDEFRNTYVTECKKLLRKLYMLLHSDTCPSYINLSGKKKKQINKLWIKLMKTTKGELYSYSTEMLLYQYPDLNVLNDIYLRACNILEITPDFVEPADRLEFMISKGTSLQRIIGFLNEEIEKIDLHMAQLELVQTEYSHAEETDYCRNALESVDTHQQKLHKKIQQLKTKVTDLKMQIKINLISEKA